MTSGAIPSVAVPRHVMATAAGDSTVLLDLERGRYYTLNAVAGRIWALLSQGVSPSELPPRLAEEYEVTPERARRDTESLIGQLLAASLLERADA
ncbi:MAG TPA: PqqD family protein [Gemmatimonadaceae bacterium]|nr:PqqD family protein [Gemmatimonadaceae bacterium]